MSETKRTQILNVQGMSCENCVGHVTRALAALEGVETAQVNLNTNSATVIYDPGQVNTAQMIAAVEEEGYAASAT